MSNHVLVFDLSAGCRDDDDSDFEMESLKLKVKDKSKRVVTPAGKLRTIDSKLISNLGLLDCDSAPSKRRKLDFDHLDGIKRPRDNGLGSKRIVVDVSSAGRKLAMDIKDKTIEKIKEKSKPPFLDRNCWSPKEDAAAAFSPTVSEEVHEVEESDSGRSTSPSPKPSSSSPNTDWQTSTTPEDELGLGFKTEPLIAEDSYSDSSEEEPLVDGDGVSIEDKIKSIDAVLNRSAIGHKPSVTSLSALSCPSPDSNSSSKDKYSNFRIRKRLDGEKGSGGSTLGDRKNEPSEIVQRMLNRKSILDQVCVYFVLNIIVLFL